MRIGSCASVDNEGAATFLCFAGSKFAPEFVVKIAKASAFSEGIRSEFANVKRAGQIYAAADYVCIPTAVDLFDIDNCAVLVESFLNGRHFEPSIRTTVSRRYQSRVASEVELVVKWSLQFLGPYTPGPETVSHACVKSLTEEFSKQFTPSSQEARLLSHLQEVIPSLELPLAPTHGDFAACNLLKVGRQLGVLDWSFFSEKTVPLVDFVMFAVSRRLSDNNQWCPGCSVALNRNPQSAHWYELLLRDSIETLADHLGLDHKLIPELWALALLAMIAADWSSLGERPKTIEAIRLHFAELAQLREE